jgi:glycine cleavage system H protein
MDRLPQVGWCAPRQARSLGVELVETLAANSDPRRRTEPTDFKRKEKNMAKVAAELQYSDEHEWVARDTGNAGSNIVSIGISAVATDALGDIVYVDLPEVGSTVSAGETCGEVESTKSVSDLYSPVTGEVTEINPAVVDDPALINSDPYGAGWLFKVAAESDGPLLSAQEYASKNGGEL